MSSDAKSFHAPRYHPWQQTAVILDKVKLQLSFVQPIVVDNGLVLRFDAKLAQICHNQW
jgi:hypothetical protein